MSDLSGTTTVNVQPQALFDYLSDTANLPKYFARMTSAAPGDGQEVKTTAKMPDGTEVQGDAHFHVEDSGMKIHWSSEGPNDYHGDLEVSPAGDNASVTVSLHTNRGDDDEVQGGIEETLANIKRLVEQG